MSACSSACKTWAACRRTWPRMQCTCSAWQRGSHLLVPHPRPLRHHSERGQGGGQGRAGCATGAAKQ